MDIAISRKVTAPELQARLSRHLTGLEVFADVDLWIRRQPKPRIAIWIVDGDEFPPGFPTAVSLVVTLAGGVDPQHWLIELARILSVEFDCRTLCDGTGFGDDDSPFWCIVWDRGEAYLGDDVETDPDEGEPGPVTIVRRLTGLDLDFGEGALDAAVSATGP